MLTGQFSDHTLKELWYRGQSARFTQNAALRLLAFMDVMDAVLTLDELRGVPGMRISPLVAGARDMFRIEVSPSWSIVFRCAHDVFIGLKAENTSHSEGPLAPASAEQYTPYLRQPTPPGAILATFFIEPMNLNQIELADHIHINRSRPNSIIHGRRSISADTALRFARAFGTSAEFWMRLQARYDMWREVATNGDQYTRIERLHARAGVEIREEPGYTIPDAADVESDSKSIIHVSGASIQPG